MRILNCKFNPSSGNTVTVLPELGTIILHRMVAMVFIPNPENHKFVWRLGDNTNCAVSNLKWSAVRRPRFKRKPSPPRPRKISPEIEGEIWRDIVGYEGMYEVSSFGRVRSLDRRIPDPIKGSRLMRGRVLTPNITRATSYYRTVMLSNNNTQIRFKVSRLVATAFLPNPKNLPVVNHLDCTRQNDTVGNLEWTTFHGNSQHAVAHGLIRKGSRVKTSKLCEQDVREIKTLIASGFSDLQICKRYGVTDGTIYFIRNNKTWKHV